MGRKAIPTEQREAAEDRKDGRKPYHVYLSDVERKALDKKAAAAGRDGADVIRRWLLGLRP